MQPTDRRASASGMPCAACSPRLTGMAVGHLVAAFVEPRRLARAGGGLDRHRRHAHAGQGVGGPARSARPTSRSCSAASPSSPLVAAAHRPGGRADGRASPTSLARASSPAWPGRGGARPACRAARSTSCPRSPPRSSVSPSLARTAALLTGRRAAAPHPRRPPRVAARPHGPRDRRRRHARSPHLPGRRRRRHGGRRRRRAPSASSSPPRRRCRPRSPSRRPRARRPRCPTGLEGKVKGITPFAPRLKDFYRVDTALVIPRVDVGELAARGRRRGRPAVLDSPSTSCSRCRWSRSDITLNCVSNEVGGPYISSTRWLGVRVARPARARRRSSSGVDQILSESTDGMTISTPGRGAHRRPRRAGRRRRWTAQPLPAAHGFPARLVTPGLYGFVGATKWLTRLTRHDLRRGRGLLDQARLGDRRARSRRSPGSTPREGWRRYHARQARRRRCRLGAAPAASRRSRCASTTARGRRPRSARTPAPTTGGSGTGRGTPRAAGTTSRCAPPTAPAAVQTDRRADPFPGPAPPASTRSSSSS